MNNLISPVKLALRIWFLTNVIYAAIAATTFLVLQKNEFVALIIFPLGLFITLPAFLGLWLLFSVIHWLKLKNAMAWLLFSLATCLLVLMYSNLNTVLLNEIFGYSYVSSYLENYLWSFCFTCFCVMGACVLSIKYLQTRFHQSLKNKNIMEHENLNFNEAVLNETVHSSSSSKGDSSNKMLVKAIIMSIMVIVLLIPTLFISNLVEEREKRQATVVQEVSSKWASDQTIGTPFIYLPYLEEVKEGKIIKTITKNLYLLPNDLNVKGKLIPEVRPRSIYKVYLYKSQLNINGVFVPTIPEDISLDKVDFTKAKLCFLLNDIKGIDEKLAITFNGKNYDFAPGLPFSSNMEKWVDEPRVTGDEVKPTVISNVPMTTEGLSVGVQFTKDMLGKPLEFVMQAKINGSENLRFLPIAANSKFSLESKWSNPKFDGNKVPNERIVRDSGFNATWNFSSANLPFGTVLREFTIQPATYAFGVSMVQPADHYSKTNRCIKYAILFIGLSFALFFIIELMQKNPLHPVQYLLVGVALLVFFTLLLSISEFLLFDYAYAIAASAIVLLISLYAKAHFKSFKTALIFGSFIGGLYTFIFVLIRLEDTALLVGSIGLFVVLSIAMYASRKINWYSSNI